MAKTAFYPEVMRTLKLFPGDVIRFQYRGADGTESQREGRVLGTRFGNILCGHAPESTAHACSSEDNVGLYRGYRPERMRDVQIVDPQNPPSTASEVVSDVLIFLMTFFVGIVAFSC